MLKVGELIKYLSENNPQANPARLAFLNYLSYLPDEDELITTELLEAFFASCLDYAHWQQNRAQLTDEVRSLLEESMDLTGIKWPQETQVIEIENLTDLTDTLQAYLNALYKKGEKYRLIVEPDKKILAIVLNSDHSVTVHSFDRKMMIRHGQMEPLKKNRVLYYTAELELDPARVQSMELAPFVTAQFQAGIDGLTGNLVRGYLHQKFFDLQGENIAAYPKLFYAIKRIEKNFINRQTDPFYQQTISQLEKTIDQVRLGDEEAIQSSMDVLAQAQNALEYVFAGDKLMSLLIRDLQHTLSSRRGIHQEIRLERRSPVKRESNSQNRVVMTPQKVEDSWEQKSIRPLFQKRERKSDLTN